MDNRHIEVNSFDEDNFLPIAGIISGISSVASAFGPSKENADKSGQLWSDYVNDNSHALPYYPSKDELIKAGRQGGWENHMIDSISKAYDQNTGTWNNPSDDWRGAVYSLNPIRVYVFKGHTEKASLNSSVNALPKTSQDKSALATVVKAGGSIAGGASATASFLKDAFAPELSQLKKVADSSLQQLGSGIANTNKDLNLPANQSVTPDGQIHDHKLSGAGSLLDAGTIPMPYLVGGGILLLIVVVGLIFFNK